MRLSNYYFYTPLSDGTTRYIIINTLFGTMDLIGEEEYRWLCTWEKTGIPLNRDLNQENLYEYLCKKKYILSEFEEQNQIESIQKKHDLKLLTFFEKPKSIGFVVNYDCNFDCPYCYQKNKVKGLLTKEQVDSILDNFGGCVSNITLIGGEPLLLENMDILNYIFNRFPLASYSIVTNGFNLMEYFHILKERKISFIQVTIDGVKDTHDLTRTHISGEKTYEKIKGNVEYYLYHNIPIRIRMNVSNQNISQVVELYNDFFTCKQYKNDLLSFEFQALFNLPIEHRSAISNQLNELARLGIIKNQMADKNIHNMSYESIKQRLKPNIKSCLLDMNTLYFDPKGRLFNCILALGSEERSIGNYFPSYHLKVKSFLSRSVLKIDKCSNCKFAFLCGGGCPNVFGDSDCFRESCFQFNQFIKKDLPSYINFLLKA